MRQQLTFLETLSSGAAREAWPFCEARWRECAGRSHYLLADLGYAGVLASSFTCSRLSGLHGPGLRGRGTQL